MKKILVLTTVAVMGLAVASVQSIASTASGLDTTDATKPLIFAVGGTEIMRLTPTGLGLGVVSPAYKLDVDGTLRTTGAATIGGATTVAGTVTATGYFHSSDARLKADIRPSRGLDVIDKLQGVSYNWKADGHPGNGVLAQDVEKVMPAAVKTGSDGYKAVDYDQLMGPMIESIKELKAQNETLSARLAAAEKKLSEQEKIQH